MPEDKEERGGLGEKGKEKRDGGLLGDEKGEDKKKKNTLLWWGLGIGGAGLLVTLFIASRNGSSQAAQTTPTTASATNPYTSSGLPTGVSTYDPNGQYPSDYWPSPYDSSTHGTTGTQASGGSSHHTSGHSGSGSSSSGSGSSSSGSKSSSSGSKSSSSGSKSSSSSNKSVTPNPTAGGAHGYVYTVGSSKTIYNKGVGTVVGTGGGLNLSNLSMAAWGNTSTIKNYANNSQLLQQYAKSGLYNPKTGLLKNGAKINL